MRNNRKTKMWITVKIAHLIQYSLFLYGLCFVLKANGSETNDDMGRYNVVWDTPSKDHSGQMPLGNGDIAGGAYAIEDDALYVFLAKNDALTYNGDIFKTGRVRIELNPNPFKKGQPFRQTLDLNTGSINIEVDDVNMKIWADANQSAYFVEIDSEKEVEVSANSDLWERFDSCRSNITSEPINSPTQDVRVEKKNSILWYYAVGDRSVYPSELAYYDVKQMSEIYPDPFRFNTFGNLLESPHLELKNGTLRGKGKDFEIRIHSHGEQNPNLGDWINDLENKAKNIEPAETAWVSHKEWWAMFWKKSWIHVNDNSIPEGKRGNLDHEAYKKARKVEDKGALVAQSYNMFRYYMACQSRGRIQAKFNGGLFTQPVRRELDRVRGLSAIEGHWIKKGEIYMGHEDARLWGRRFTFQNQRHLYWPLLMSGDFELMAPFYDHYSDLLPIRTAINKAWFGHDGAYFRENIELTGGERDCGSKNRHEEFKPLKTPPGENEGKGFYHSYYFGSGMECLAMMIEYVKYTNDQKFAKVQLLPFAEQILTFFDQHYERDVNGKIRIDPAMVVETFWVAVNPAQDIAGLLHNLEELLTLNIGSQKEVAFWQRFLKEVPPVHTHEINGKMAIAPAYEYSDKKNAENGELYPVFPYRRFGVGMGSKELVQWTCKNRTVKNAFGAAAWTQDQTHQAYAGMAAEAQAGLIQRYTHTSTMLRFPVFGKERPDSCPDMNHFGSGSTALQRMLLQETPDGKIHLLPAWPVNWDAEFKLYLANQTILTGSVKDGALAEWSISPLSRKEDVVLYAPQK